MGFRWMVWVAGQGVHPGQEIPGCATRRPGERRMEPDPTGSRAKEPGTHRPGVLP
jgi:hypothetical protein